MIVNAKWFLSYSKPICKPIHDIIVIPVSFHPLNFETGKKKRKFIK